jgi:hypothetical protein
MQIGALLLVSSAFISRDTAQCECTQYQCFSTCASGPTLNGLSVCARIISNNLVSTHSPVKHNFHDLKFKDKPMQKWSSGYRTSGVGNSRITQSVLSPDGNGVFIYYYIIFYKFSVHAVS